MVSDAESVVGDSPVIGRIYDTDDTEAAPEGGLMVGGVHWDNSWINNCDLYDDLDD